MEFITTAKASTVVLQLNGRFDAYAVEPVHAWLQEQIDLGNINMVVNLEGVNFMDLTALSTLMRGLKQCREKYGDLSLCCLQPPVRLIFELTQLDQVFHIYETEDEANENVRGSNQ